MRREDFSMKETRNTKGRRKFIEDGLRTVALSGLAFVGLSLGWRGASGSGEKSSCAVDLPCRSCSQLAECRQAKARETKREYHESSNRNPGKDGGLE
jgi:hypothetical protein